MFITGLLVFVLGIEWIKPLALNLGKFIPGRLGRLLTVYLNSKYASRSYGFSIGAIERIGTFLLVFLNEKIILKKYTNNRFIINSLYLYVFISLYCSEFYILVDRISNLFIYSYWILYPNIISLCNKTIKPFVLIVVIGYGISRVVKSHMDLTFYYDSFLLPHKSFEERSINFERWASYIYKKLL
jgi:hypothetical protein